MKVTAIQGYEKLVHVLDIIEAYLVSQNKNRSLSGCQLQ